MLFPVSRWEMAPRNDGLLTRRPIGPAATHGISAGLCLHEGLGLRPADGVDQVGHVLSPVGFDELAGYGHAETFGNPA